MGCAFCDLPRSKMLKWPGAWWAHCPRWVICLMHLPDPRRSVSWVCPEGTVPGVLCAPLGSWSQALTLLADVNSPGSQEDMVSNWQPAHSLVEDVVSGAEIGAVPCLPFLAVTHMPLCLWWGRVINGSWFSLLWYLLGHNPFFYEHAKGHHGVLEPFVGKVRFFFFFLIISLVIPWFGFLCQIRPLRLFSWHSNLVLTLRTNDAANDTSLPSPLAADGYKGLSHFSASRYG